MHDSKCDPEGKVILKKRYTTPPICAAQDYKSVTVKNIWISAVYVMTLL